MANRVRIMGVFSFEEGKVGREGTAERSRTRPRVWDGRVRGTFRPPDSNKARGNASETAGIWESGADSLAFWNSPHSAV